MKVKEMGKQKQTRPKYIVCKGEDTERAQRVLDSAFPPDERLITASVDVLKDEVAVTITEHPTEPTIMTGTEIDEPIVLKPRRYVPPACSACTNLRPDGKDFTEVYRTTRETGYIFRYCKCGFCGNTFKDSEKVV